ncbi:MAG TPA: transcriptional regulator, partial [Candidatus Kapabacteria bacterium]|nr:transcriptional regulator [Candidatus Kapabacteria bacterium]
MASRNTPLKQALQKKPDRPRVTPLDVFERARALWLQGERLNLGSLAETLGVSRATLFRWVGNKELLMGEILWSTYQPLVERALDQATGKGVDFMVDVFRRVNLDIMKSESLRQFMSQDPAYALRVLTSND